ncbi:tRNA threonylcarbamoyl adenosine modification protein YjeE [Desulfuromonas soudanensis]|uniref:tRNA threonylcarbamoyladenosine biosynthesis protein TsaE n=1 Tax=Desulfuromonas soudanensis TaxID=1603606 RepID=A0A0M3QG82_9BACT|nr:tRNA (adenosine(37)-N6)-threonylcarbamoyltransferase complex ATPase subunit type 1 TsaE [Desulfuromonas soudanensis]ALC17529.1 tRNA threonylcarbamoyl adenosine modification protein YjeE [Desulfuromonas soudanensis]
MRTWSLTTACAAETRALGETLGALLTEHLIVGLWGDLGTGKTCLTQGLARGLGVPVEEPVTSPSYTLMNHYSGRLELHHFDLYRLAGPEDLVDLGFDEYLQGGGVVVVEWAERAPGIETEGLSIRLAHAGEEERRIDFVAEGRVAEALLARLAATLTTERGGG